MHALRINIATSFDAPQPIRARESASHKNAAQPFSRQPGFTAEVAENAEALRGSEHCLRVIAPVKRIWQSLTNIGRAPGTSAISAHSAVSSSSFLVSGHVCSLGCSNEPHCARLNELNSGRWSSIILYCAKPLRFRCNYPQKA